MGAQVFLGESKIVSYLYFTYVSNIYYICKKRFKIDIKFMMKVIFATWSLKNNFLNVMSD